MIPALLGIPVVEGVVGGVVGSVANIFSPSQPSAPGSASASTFTPYLNSATSAASASPVPTSPTGTLRSDEWGHLAPTDLQTWMQSLAGKHVVATDESGRTISGAASVQQIGHTQALNIGGHLVSLSQLKQISWSPSVA